MSAEHRDIPLCVDLDGTLVRSDLLLESIFALLKGNIFLAFLLPVWLLGGKAAFKQKIADRVTLDATTLPYHEPFLEYLRGESRARSDLVLATASNEKFASAVSQHLGIFSQVIASTAEQNVSGARKRALLVERFGDKGFDYAGNARVDIPIWAAARSAILVNPERGVARRAERETRDARVFDDRTSSKLALYLRAIRLHQWLKNVLVFVPLVMAHRVMDIELVGSAALAFLSFGFCASSVYLLNDLVDLPNDRRHQRKKARPLAAGRIPIFNAAALVPVFLAASFGVALLLPVEFGAVLSFYYLTTMAYSFRFKSSAPVDVLILAGLYTLRIISGAAAVSVVPSFWLLAFSMFLFLSLALVKRYTEVAASSSSGAELAGGRGYQIDDSELLSQFGIASGFSAVLVLALYINSDAVLRLYSHPELIWLLCPLLLYIVSRIWLLARRQELDEDPVLFAIEDRRTHLAAGVGLFFLWLAV